jgi:hypothetical protein
LTRTHVIHEARKRGCDEENANASELELIRVCPSWASSASADAVVDWNAIAVQSILTPVANGHTTQLSQIDLAIVLASLFQKPEAITWSPQSGYC